MKYSPTVGCFYPSDLNYGESLPADAVVVPDEDFELAMGRGVNQRVVLAEGRIQLEEMVKTQEEVLLEQEQAIRGAFDSESESPVEVEITEGTYSFNGGQDSAAYIQGAVSLAQALSETDVEITDVGNIARRISLESALHISVIIGKAFRVAFLKKQAALVALQESTYTGE